jgi:hypothetical protein
MAQSLKDFCRRYHPKDLGSISKYLETHTESLYLDFEDILTGLEGLAGYKALMEAVAESRILSVEHKGFLTCHLVSCPNGS